MAPAHVHSQQPVEPGCDAPGDAQVLFHHQLMGRPLNPGSLRLSHSPGPLTSPSPVIIDPLGSQAASPSPYYHALSYRSSLAPPSKATSPHRASCASSFTLAVPYSNASSSCSSSSSSFALPIDRPTSPSQANRLLPLLAVDIAPSPSSSPSSSQSSSCSSSTTAAFPAPQACFSARSSVQYASFSYPKPLLHLPSHLPFDPDLEAERVRRMKMERRRSIGLTPRPLPLQSSRPSSPLTISGRSVSHGGLPVRPYSSVRLRAGLRSHSANGAPVYQPSPLRSASTPDVAALHQAAEDPKQKHRKMREEYAKMKRDRIQEEKGVVKALKTATRADQGRKMAWIETNVKSIKARKRVGTGPAPVASLPLSQSVKNDSDRRGPSHDSSSSDDMIQRESKPMWAEDGDATGNRSDAVQDCSPMRDPFRKSIIPGGNVDEPTTPIKVKLARRQPKSIKKKISLLFDGIKNYPSRTHTVKANNSTRIDLVDPKSPLAAEAAPKSQSANVDSQSNSNTTTTTNNNNSNSNSWLASIRFSKSHNKKI